MNLAEPIVPKADNTGMENFLRGFALLSQMADRRNKLEEAYKALQLRSMISDRKHEEALDRMDMMGEHYKNQSTLQQMREERLLNTARDQHKQDMSDTQRSIEMHDKIAGIDAKLGSNEYQKQLDIIASEYSDLVNDKQTPAYNDFKNYTTRQMKVRQEMKKGWESEISKSGFEPYDFSPTGRMRFQPQVKENKPTGNVFTALADSKAPADVFWKDQSGNMIKTKGYYRTYTPAEWKRHLNNWEEFYGSGSVDAAAPNNLQDRAQSALNDPDATPQEKEAARKILGIKE